MKIGLLMIRDENDVLEDTLAVNSQLVDAFYVLDGSDDHTTARRICGWFDNCAGYTHDRDIPSPIADASRQHLLDQARHDNPGDHWYLLLHGDEMWMVDPSEAIAVHPDAEGFEFRLPFAFPRAWDTEQPAIAQLTEFALPGYPEFRMFKDNPAVAYKPATHFQCKPQGINTVYRYEQGVILHYPYRSPNAQFDRAWSRRTWSPENYQHIANDGAVFWTDEMLADLMARSNHYTHTADLAVV